MSNSPTKTSNTPEGEPEPKLEQKQDEEANDATVAPETEDVDAAVTDKADKEIPLPADTTADTTTTITDTECPKAEETVTPKEEEETTTTPAETSSAQEENPPSAATTVEGDVTTSKSSITEGAADTEDEKKVGLTAKGDQRHYVKHSYSDRANDVLENLTESDENTLRLYREDNIGGTFPIKLQIVLKVVEKLGQQHIISWLPHGRSFMIHRPREFEDEIMGRFFKQTKLTSFQRQLNLYDFQRITHGRDAGSYYHELFLRGKPLLAKRMIRRKVKGTKIRASSSPDDEPNFYSMPFMGPISDSPPMSTSGNLIMANAARAGLMGLSAHNGGPGSNQLLFGGAGGGMPGAGIQSQFGGGAYGHSALHQLSNISALHGGNLFNQQSFQQQQGNPFQHQMYEMMQQQQQQSFGGVPTGGPNSFMPEQASPFVPGGMSMGGMNGMGGMGNFNYGGNTPNAQMQRNMMLGHQQNGNAGGMMTNGSQQNPQQEQMNRMAMMNQNAFFGGQMSSPNSGGGPGGHLGGGMDPRLAGLTGNMGNTGAGGSSDQAALNAQLLHQLQMQNQQTQNNNMLLEKLSNQPK